METLNEQLVEGIDRYIQGLFAPEDAALAQNVCDAAAAGLPAIQVSPNEGKLLYLLVRISRWRSALWLVTAPPGSQGRCRRTERSSP
jgi:caffeoyl-CoA O-methyltransferase